MSINKIMVVGAGQMGLGIAQVAAQAGYQVLLNDLDMDRIEKAKNIIQKNLTKDVEKGRRNLQECQNILSCIQGTIHVEDAKDVDIVIEAASENLQIKKQIFQSLDQFAPAHAILATNTSSLPITQIAATTSRPDKVIGMHFMNPVPVMKLVEIIRGLATSDETYQVIKSLSSSMQKISVEVHDGAGFVSNRVLMPMINEAIFCVYEGIASVEDVDSVMKLGMNHPMGPLTLADFIGLDTCLSIMNVLYEGFCDSKYRPCPLLVKYVAAGWLGKKTGRGFYNYN